MKIAWALALLGTLLAAKAPGLRSLEARSGGRLGVCVLDAGGRKLLEYRARERFPLCSTFKVLLAGAVLFRVDAGRAALDRRVPYGEKDLLAYAPVTRARAAEGALTLEELCAASVQVSDNTAANLLLDTLGGPGAVTVFARSLGDPVTRLDRKEPELNDVPPGDPRDTTTPEAMARTLRELLAGKTLSPASQRRLAGWMATCTTGTHRLRAGFPASWQIQDKTGSGFEKSGIANDIAVAIPQGGSPLYIAAYLTGAKGDAQARDAILEEVGRIVSKLPR
ncbi:class A beta-lactamase [Mesoterricola silvestris]|uniref:Beta-lactamase n=1 Tax=Mesoterricola silvestris TaxID=2927979 RepID=A0AA48GJK4_9BACT|nr:class A beta-lactamase [Mesoterricola silvestris]BDU72492.1 beta-lactamase [Mesoterricola silvestris]